MQQLLGRQIVDDYFGFDKDLHTCLVYVTPETSTHQSSRNSVWKILEEEIAIFSTTGHILLTGDFNAHTGLLPDCVNRDFALATYPTATRLYGRYSTPDIDEIRGLCSQQL